jgi:hypothetical protein
MTESWGQAPICHAYVGHNYNARNVLNVRKRHTEDGASRGYHAQRGGCYDSEEDRSPLFEPPRPWVFSQDILNASFPAQFRQTTNITKYSRETNPELWLDDYRLTCQLGGTDDDRFIIRNLPLCLANSARA